MLIEISYAYFIIVTWVSVVSLCKILVQKVTGFAHNSKIILNQTSERKK